MANEDAVPRIQRIENESGSFNSLRIYLLNEKEKSYPKVKPVEAQQEGSQAHSTAQHASQAQPNIRLVFKVDQDTNQVTVLVIDKSTQKLIRSIPFDEQSKLKQGELLELLI